MAHKGPQGLGVLPHGGEGLRREVGLRLGHGGVEPAHGQPLQVVVARGGIQEVARKGRVKDNTLRGKSLLQKGAGQVLYLVGDLLDISGKKLPQKVVVALQAAGKEHRGFARRLDAPLYAQTSQVRQHQTGHRLRLVPPERE